MPMPFTPRSALKKAYLAAKSFALIDTADDWRSSVFLAGGARSGTTWLAELINFDRSYRFMFEPFGVRQLGDFWYGSYVRPDDGDPKLRSLAERVLRGRFKHWWVDQFNSRLVSRRRLVKEVRANLWIGWLRKQFPQLPIVLLVRHPIPTVRSRFKRYFDAENKEAIDTDPEQRTKDFVHYLLGQRALVEDYLAPFVGEILAARSVFEQRLITWCVQYYVPLRQLQAGDAHVCYYEHFCMQPRDEIQRLFSYIGREAGDFVFDRINKPSRMARQREMPDPWKLVSDWRKHVSDEDMETAMRVLASFGLDKIYGPDPMPNADGLTKFSEAFRSLPVRGN